MLSVGYYQYFQYVTWLVCIVFAVSCQIVMKLSVSVHFRKAGLAFETETASYCSSRKQNLDELLTI